MNQLSQVQSRGLNIATIVIIIMSFTTSIFSQSKSLRFNESGTNDIVTASDFSSLGDEYTIEGWIKPTTESGEQHLWELWTGDSGDQFYLSNGGYLSAPAIVGGSDGGYAARKVNANEWTHIAYVRSANSLIIYKNGVAVMWGTPGGVGAKETLALAHYRTNGNEYSATAYKGFMDDIRVWSSARTQIEIDENKSIWLSGNEPKLEVLYSFNDQSGTTVADGTSNNRVGTLANMISSAWQSDGVSLNWTPADNEVKTYYVSVTGNDSPSRGLSEAQPWRTIAYAALRATTPGDNVHVKAGLYKKENFTIESGNSASSIVFEGYDANWNSVTNLNWWVYNENQSNLDATKMPLLDGGSRINGGVATFIGDYNIFKNFQIINYNSGVQIYDHIYSTVENIIGVAFGDSTKGSEPNGFGIKIRGDSNADGHNTINNCRIINTHGHGISIDYSSYNTVKNCSVYNDDPFGTHYYIHIGSESDGNPSNHNVIDNCYVQRKTGGIHFGHGITIKGGTNYNGATNGACKYNTIKNCEVKNVNGDAFAARRSGAIENEFVDCLATGDTEGNGFYVRDAASNNTFTNCKTDNCGTAVTFWSNGEDPSMPTTAHDNKFYNCIFSKTKNVQIKMGDPAYVKITKDNSFINCVFDDGTYLFDAIQNSSNNSMTNCIVTNVDNYKNGSATLTFNYTNSDFYSNGFSTPAGSNLITGDPQFVDLANVDYHITSSSPCVNSGTSSGVTLPSTDYEGNTRVQGGTVDIGAYETASSSSSNYALRFNAEATKDEYVSIASIPTSGTVTIEFWAKLEGSNDDTDVMINMGGDSKRLTLKSSSHLPAWSDGWNAYSSTAGISLNTWHHIAYVASSGTLQSIYIDGLPQTIDGGTSVSMPTATWYLASWYGGGASSLNYIGCIDELRLWNDVRTASEISSNKDSELQGNEQGLIGYWKFNEGSGTTLADSKGSANGTLHNMESGDWVNGPNLSGGNPPSNIPPVANAGSDQTVTDTDNNGSESVTLNGSGSSDSDGTITSYVWKEGATQLATSANPSVSLAVGTHTITLTVTDNDGATNSNDVVITVNAGGGSSTNYALRFNAEATKDEYVSIASIPTSGTVTIEFWAKLEGSNDDTDVMINMGGDSKRLTLKSSSHLPAWSDGWNAYSSTAGISLNTWHHIAYVASSGTLQSIYIDGLPQTIDGGTSVSMPTATWYLASWYGGGASSLNYIGCIDELRLWNDVRTASEISSNKDSELQGNEQGLIGYWKFNEGSGTTLADSKGSANGTLHNMESGDWVSGASSLSKKGYVNGNDEVIPKQFSLSQNYPNPFNPSTIISFALPKAENVKLFIYNMLGEKIAELVNENMSAGIHSVPFDASKFVSGIYIYRISAGQNVITKKMMLLK